MLITVTLPSVEKNLLSIVSCDDFMTNLKKSNVVFSMVVKEEDKHESKPTPLQLAYLLSEFEELMPSELPKELPHMRDI